MKKAWRILIGIALFIFAGVILFIMRDSGPIKILQNFQGKQARMTLLDTILHTNNQQEVTPTKPKESYWFVLHRKSNQEMLYQGLPGDKGKSTIIKTFQVKTGIPGERPTPLPHLVGREYWLLIDEFEMFDNLETAPYFLTLDIPVSEEDPFGPVPYNECNGQCNWILPGAFGLHGVAGNPEKLSVDDSGSSGCIRHSDEDITYLYNLLDPKQEPIRYYIEDN